MAVLVAMAGTGCTDNAMAAVMQDPRLPIGYHIRDQPNPTEYLRRQIERARTKARPSGSDSSFREGRTSQVMLNSQRKELRLLHNMRRANVPFVDWVAGYGLDLVS